MVAFAPKLGEHHLDAILLNGAPLSCAGHQQSGELAGAAADSQQQQHNQHQHSVQPEQQSDTAEQPSPRQKPVRTQLCASDSQGTTCRCLGTCQMVCCTHMRVCSVLCSCPLRGTHALAMDMLSTVQQTSMVAGPRKSAEQHCRCVYRCPRSWTLVCGSTSGRRCRTSWPSPAASNTLSTLRSRRPLRLSTPGCVYVHGGLAKDHGPRPLTCRPGCICLHTRWGTLGVTGRNGIVLCSSADC
jgi:hypothetical protein